MTDIADTTDTIDTAHADDDPIAALRAEVSAQQQRIADLESRFQPADAPMHAPSAQAPRTGHAASPALQRSRAREQARATGRRNDILTYMRLRRA